MAMEAASLFLLLLLPPADTAGDMAAGIQAALRSQLGEVSMAIAPDALMTPSMWQGQHAQMRARFVAHVVWQNQDKAKVELLPGSDSSENALHEVRELAFAAQDGKSERGRAIGLVIAEALRSSPTAAWADGIYESGALTVLGPSRLQVDGLFASQYVGQSTWAWGPCVAYGFGLTEAFRARAAGMALFSGRNTYRYMGLTAGVDWDPLRFVRKHISIGIGLVGGFFYESASLKTGEESSSPTKASAAAGANLHVRVTLWRWLRLFGEASDHVLSGSMSVTYGEYTKTTVAYSRWRPGFAVGLEMAL